MDERHGLLLGASARKNVGIPIVDRRREAEVARQQRVGRRRGAYEQDQECRERRFGDVQLCDALEVAQRLPALLHHRRYHGEAALHEDEVGHASRHLGPAALRDREPGCLQGGHVVHTVSHHRDVATRIRKRLHEAALVFRGDPSHDGGGEGGVAQLRWIGGQLRPRECTAVHAEPGVAGDRGDRLGRVARQDLQLDIFPQQVGDHLARVGP